MYDMPLQSLDIFCPACGYDLRGTESLRCPECGKSHTHEQLATNRIPWTYGRGVRAFASTVWVATFRPSRLALCFNDGVTWQRGRSFRWICVLILVSPAAALLLYQHGWELLSMVPGIWVRPAGGMPAGLAGNIVGWLSQAGVPWYIGMLHWPVVLVTLLSTTLALSLLPIRLLSFAKLPADRREYVLNASQYVCGSAIGGVFSGAVIALAVWAFLYRLTPNTPLLYVKEAFTALPIVALIVWVVAFRRFWVQAARTSGVQLPWFWLVLPPVLLVVLLVWMVLLPSALGLLIMIFDTLA